MTTISNLNELEAFLEGRPDGTTCNILASDLEAGNFSIAHFETPAGHFGYNLRYTGPVADGYVSPFEASNEPA